MHVNAQSGPSVTLGYQDIHGAWFVLGVAGGLLVADVRMRITAPCWWVAPRNCCTHRAYHRERSVNLYILSTDTVSNAYARHGESLVCEFQLVIRRTTSACDSPTIMARYKKC